MSDRAQPGFVTTELNPELLSTPFGCQTNWHVITGAPCCGKTTLINHLAGMGFRTVPETGRQYIEREMAKGRTLDEIRESEVAFCYLIRNLQLATERALPAQEVAFLDRAFPDSLSFFRIRGLDPNEVLPDCFQHRYASVFVLDRYPLHQDGIRTEDDVQSDLMDEWLARDYATLGYSVVRVPVMPPRGRPAFVLERLSAEGLI